MDLNLSFLISEFLGYKLDVFTLDEFCSFLRKKNARIPRTQAEAFLHSSAFVFSLVDDKFVTRAGVFTDQYFSFKPTKEEIKKGYFLLGHRCMPFVNPEISPDNTNITIKDNLIRPEPVRFSLNLALDLYSFFGEGYSLSYILNDRANTDFRISALGQQDLPSSIMLTAWPLDIFGSKKIEYGDRILCKVVDWSCCQIEISLIKANQNPLSVSTDEIEREEWYSKYEDAMLLSMEKNGPCGSIEEQMAYMFLENMGNLCKKSCGSSEEFLAHTKKISFCPFGVESRLWKSGESVPFAGPWNGVATSEGLISEISQMFSPNVIDAYLSREIFKEVSKKKNLTEEEFENLLYIIFPSSLDLLNSERKSLLLNIKKRHDIIFKHFDKDKENKIASLRDYVLALFTDVSTLLCDIGCSCDKFDEFPQQDLVILTQLYSNLITIIEELQNPLTRNQFPVDDTMVSLDGMNETFIEIKNPLKNTLKKISYSRVNIKKFNRANDLIKS